MSTYNSNRKDYASNWNKINPLLEDQCIGVEIDTGKAKVGDGIHFWRDLPYVTEKDTVKYIEIPPTKILKDKVIDGIPNTQEKSDIIGMINEIITAIDTDYDVLESSLGEIGVTIPEDGGIKDAIVGLSNISFKVSNGYDFYVHVDNLPFTPYISPEGNMNIYQCKLGLVILIDSEGYLWTSPDLTVWTKVTVMKLIDKVIYTVRNDINRSLWVHAYSTADNTKCIYYSTTGTNWYKNSLDINRITVSDVHVGCAYNLAAEDEKRLNYITVTDNSMVNSYYGKTVFKTTDKANVGVMNPILAKNIMVAERTMGLNYDSRKLAYSVDGKSWQNILESDDGRLLGYFNGRFIAYGSERMAYSDDGFTWKTSNLLGEAKYTGVAYGNGKLILTARYSTDLAKCDLSGIFYSIDNGSSWVATNYGNTKSSTGEKFYIGNPFFHNGTFYASAVYNNKLSEEKEYSLLYSKDGFTWRKTDIPLDRKLPNISNPLVFDGKVIYLIKDNEDRFAIIASDYM